MRVAIVGAMGLLGRHLTEELRAQGHAVLALDRSTCDLASPDREAFYHLRDRLAAHDAHLVFNTAAFTDVDGAELAEDRAFLVNALGAEMVARASDAVGAAVCHISTDFVFAGDQLRPYDEFDPPSPRSAYARSKRAGEELVLRATRRAYVVRVGGLYGRGGQNFFSTMVARLRQGQSLRLDAERQVTPTWVRPLARQLIHLSEQGEHGTYHATCQGHTTWHEFATELCSAAAQLGRPLPATFSPVSTAEVGAKAHRPAMSVLDCRVLRLRGLLLMPTWQEALRDYLAELLAHGHL
jgi:dTDP-4-dehydrorhamnose reductase